MADMDKFAAFFVFVVLNQHHPSRACIHACATRA